MTWGVRKYLVGSVVLIALIAVAGCSHYMLAEREPWRHDAEAACINSGVPEEAPGRVRISAISGPGACGIDYPLKVTELGVSGPLGYTDAPMEPPSTIPNASMPQQWPGVQSSPLPPPQAAPPGYNSQPYGTQSYGQQPYTRAYPQQTYNPPPSSPPPYQPQYGAPQYGMQPYGSPQYAPPPSSPPHYAAPQYRPAQGASPPYAAPTGAPISLTPPGVAPPADDLDETDAPLHPYYNAPAPSPSLPAQVYSPRPLSEPASEGEPASPGVAPLGPSAPLTTASAGPVQVQPAATLACPLVSMLDKWISAAVQPAALKWFHQPVVEIKQISAYSCRGMNGNPNAHISEHAFGNALDIAEFDLADGHKISVQYGWHGSPEEQGFLHDVQDAACQDFTTVLAPGANVYHYNHIHVDLMRRAGRPFICEPAAIPGDVAAARARARYAAEHGEPHYTGSIRHKGPHPLGYAGEADDHLPLAEPGDD